MYLNDLQAFKDRDPACLSYSSAILHLKGYHALQAYRVAHKLWNEGRKLLALALQSRISEVVGDHCLLVESCWSCIFELNV
jgi:serine O-acetyltransferase